LVYLEKSLHSSAMKQIDSYNKVSNKRSTTLYRHLDHN
jgi:hypothetical protein